MAIPRKRRETEPPLRGLATTDRQFRGFRTYDPATSRVPRVPDYVPRVEVEAERARSVDEILDLIMTSEELELAVELACQELEEALGLVSADHLALWEADGHIVCGLLADMAQALNRMRAESAEIGANIAAEVFPDPADGVKRAALAAVLEQVVGASVGLNPFADFVSVAAVASCAHPQAHPGLYEICDETVKRSALSELIPRGPRFIATLERQQDLQAYRPQRSPDGA